MKVLFSLLLLSVFSYTAYAQTSNVNVTVGVGSAPVLVINQFFINPDDVPIGNPSNFSIEVSNIGNIDGNGSAFIQIYNGLNVIDSFSSDNFTIPFQSPNNLGNISVVHVLNYPIGNYTALGFVNYNNKTIGPVYKNFSINKGQPPSVYLVSPSNHSWTHETNNSLEFIFYVDDVDSSQFSCRLYFDSQLAGENNSVIKLTNTSIKSNMSFSDGVHSWYVECTDNGGNTVQSEIREINIGTFCSNLDVEGLYYTLEKNLSANNSCFTLSSPNITLDCQGNTIFFESGNPILINAENSTVKNCILIQTQDGSSSGIISNAKSVIENNTIELNGSDSTGIQLNSGDNLLTGNAVILHGNSSTGLSLSNSNQNTIVNNSITLDSSSSRFVYMGLNSLNNSIINNYYIPPADLQGFIFSFIVDQRGANISLPSVNLTPSLNIYIPQDSVSNITEVNITTQFINRTKVPINTASGNGEMTMLINIFSSRELSTNDSNPYIFNINISTLNLSDTEKSRLGVFFYNSSSQKWEAVLTLCNSTTNICTAQLTHFSEFGLIIKIPLTVTAEKKENQLPLSGRLSCTKELAEVLSEPGTSIEVRFLDSPYTNMIVKLGTTDENGSFRFIADLPGRYQVTANKTGFANNSITLIAADDCVPRITFVRKWLDCSYSPCIITLPVMTSQMKNVEVDLSDVSPILYGNLDIRDKTNAPVSFYSYSGNALSFPLITDIFTISSYSKVKSNTVVNQQDGTVTIQLLNSGNTARISVFVLPMPDIGNRFITNVSYVTANETKEITKYSIYGGKITIDQQLYIPSSASFMIKTSAIPLRCTLDNECPSDSICKDNTCVVISCPCGYIVNRTCVNYEFCQDSDCSAGKSCLSHVCIYTPPSVTEEEKRYIADRLNVLVSSIQSAQQQGEDVTSARQLLDEARKAYEAGDFEKAKELIAQAQQIFIISREVTPGIPYLTILLVGAVVLVLIFAMLLVRKLSSSDYKEQNKKSSKKK